MENVIFHIDVNSAFLSWEAVYRLAHKGGTLDLRNVPSAVVGDITLRDRLHQAGCLSGTAYDHMSGGISREKRTVDYDKVTVL